MLGHRLCFLVILCALAWPVQAATRYASPTGSGSTCSLASPCSLATAQSQAVAGDTVSLRGGTYSGALSWGSRSGTNGNPIIYAGYPGETVTVQMQIALNTDATNSSITDLIFQSMTIDGSAETGLNSGVFLWHSTSTAFRVQRITLQDLVIKNWTLHGIQGYFAENVIVRRVKSSGNGRGCPNYGYACRLMQGVYGTMPSLLIEDSEFFQNNGYGIQLYNQYGADGSNSIIRQNKIYGNLGDGGAVIGFGSNIQFYNNLVYNNAGGGLYPVAYGCSSCKVYNNTFYGNGSAPVLEVGGNGGATNTVVTNNIFANNQQGISNLGTGTTFATNLCQATGTHCATVADPQFAAPAGNDFHLTATSPISPSTNLCSTFSTDAEGKNRSCDTNFGFGAYVATSNPNPQPDPEGLLVQLLCNEGTGLTALDTSGHNRHCTLNSASWVSPGLQGNAAMNATSCVIPGTAALKPTTEAGLAVRMKRASVGVNGEVLASLPNDAFLIYLRPDGQFSCQTYDGSTFPSAIGGNGLTNTTMHVSCSYAQDDGIRLRVNNAQVAFTPMSTALSYSLPGGGNLQVGRSDTAGIYDFGGILDDFHAFDQRITPEGNTILYLGESPGANLTSLYQLWTRPNVILGIPLTDVADVNANRSQHLNVSIGLRAGIYNGGGSVTAHYPLACCNVSNCEADNDWIIVGDSPNAVGVAYSEDTEVAMGDPISDMLLPSGGFNAISGFVVSNPVNTIVTVPLGAGEKTEIEYRPLTFHAPLVAGSQLQCKPVRVNGSPLDGYGSIPVLTLTDPLRALVSSGVTSKGISR